MSVTFLVAFPPVLYVQLRRGAIPRRRGYVGVAAWLAVAAVGLASVEGAGLAVGEPAQSLLALAAGFGAVVSYGRYRRTRRRAGLG